MKYREDYPDVLPQKEVRRLIRLAQKGDKEAKGKVVLHNMKLACKESYFWKWMAPVEDLIQDAACTIARCVDKFDLKRNLQFSTYATWAIRHDFYRTASKSSKRLKAIRFFGKFEYCKDRVCHKSKGELAKVIINDEIDEVQKLVPTLTQKQKKVLEKRLSGDSLAKIAIEMGVTREMARMYELSALRKLSKGMGLETEPVSLSKV